MQPDMAILSSKQSGDFCTSHAQLNRATKKTQVPCPNALASWFLIAGSPGSKVSVAAICGMKHGNKAIDRPDRAVVSVNFALSGW